MDSRYPTQWTFEFELNFRNNFPTCTQRLNILNNRFLPKFLVDAVGTPLGVNFSFCTQLSALDWFLVSFWLIPIVVGITNSCLLMLRLLTMLSLYSFYFCCLRLLKTKVISSYLPIYGFSRYYGKTFHTYERNELSMAVVWVMLFGPTLYLVVLQTVQTLCMRTFKYMSTLAYTSITSDMYRYVCYCMMSMIFTLWFIHIPTILRQNTCTHTYVQM